MVSISNLLRVYYVTVIDTYKYLLFYLKRINLRHYNLILLKININKQITLKEINKNLIILSNSLIFHLYRIFRLEKKNLIISKSLIENFNLIPENYLISKK